MAAATAVALTGLAMAGYQAYQGHKNAQEGRDALADYKRQDLAKSNPYKNLQISTVGSDIMREDNQINSANAIDAMREGGSRGIAMLPMLTARNNQANQETRAYLDNQVLKRDYAIAGDQTAIRDMQENRENADLAGIGQQIQVGRQDMWSGFRGMGNAAMWAAQNGAFEGTPQVEGVESALKPVGLTPAYTNSLIPKAPSIPSFYKFNPLG